MRYFFLFILLFSIMTTVDPAQAAEVSATVDKTIVESGESLTFTVSITGGKGEVDVSGIRDFEVASRGTSSSYNIVNGNVSSKVEYLFTLIPLKQGRLLIPPLPVTVKGRTVYTEMIAIEVSNRPQPGAGSGTASEEAAEVFARLSVSDETPYLGEQITCRLSLYNAVSIANATVTSSPDFTGFSAEKLADNRNYSKIVNGRRFNVTDLVWVLTPESVGKHTIGPAAVSCDLVVRSRTPRGRSLFDSFFNDPFFGGGQSLEPRRLTAEPVVVTVRPLPEYNGTEPFSGLVGEFSIAAEIDQTDITEGDSVNMAVTISGRGNIKAASSPVVDLVDAFKVYEDAPVEEIAASEAGVSGRKRFPAALVALKPGDYTLGPFSLTYFDVNRKSYITISTAPVTVTVKKSEKSQTVDLSGDRDTAGGLSPSVRKQAVEFTGHDIFPVKEDLSALEHQEPLPLTIFALLVGGPFVLYGLAALLMARVRRKIDDSTLMARKARTLLKAAAGGRASVEDRLDLLFKAVVYAVYARAGRKGESLTYREARQLLKEKGCEEALADKSCRLLEEIEQARYGGRTVDPAFFKEKLTSAGTLIRRILP